VFKLIDKNTVLVDLGAPPVLPIPGVTVSSSINSGLVELEYREETDALYRNGKEARLFVSDKQRNQGIEGEKLFWDILLDRGVAHPNELDALLEYPHLIPKHFGQAIGDGLCIDLVFWGARFVGFRSTFVRCLRRWRGEEVWHEDYHLVHSTFDAQMPAVLL
jgi:hypothetical protein